MRASIAVGGLLSLILAGCQKPGPAPDLLISGGAIYTGLDASPTVEAVSVKDGHILATGLAKDLAKTAGPATKKIDLRGGALYPGFTDAHAHLYGIGEREVTLNLDKVASIAELVKEVGAKVDCWRCRVRSREQGLEHPIRPGRAAAFSGFQIHADRRAQRLRRPYPFLLGARSRRC